MYLLLIIIAIIVLYQLKKNVDKNKHKQEFDEYLKRQKLESIETGKEIDRLKNAYDLALSGTDKKAALDAGRAYYRKKNGLYVTQTDEVKINNDISTMTS